MGCTGLDSKTCGQASRGATSHRPAFAPADLEVEAELHGFRPRRHVVRAAERREEVIQRGLVGDVDGRKAQAPLVPIAMEQIVVAHRDVEQIAWCDAWWILVVVLGSGRGYGYKLRPVTCCRAQIGAEGGTDRGCGRGKHAAAKQPCLELLIRRDS